MDELILKKYCPMTETTYYTLLSVKEARHGYAIMQFVRELTKQRLQLGTGTLYSMLSRLVEDQLIKILSEENGKKTYQITDIGMKLILLEIERLKYQLDNGIQVFSMEEGELEK